ncbi:MAG: YdcF family protein [Patescibacteria group bacterium]|jgi:uncharacterized SAM-binding protein YcdF (DUF218 family)
MLDVIIILGKGLTADGTLPEIVQHEIDYALNLAKPIIFSGDYWGLCPNPARTTEAEAMKKYAQGKMLTPVQLYCENKSKDTIGNIIFSKKIIDQNNFKNILILSSFDHIKRVQYICAQVFKNDYDIKYHGHQHTYTVWQYFHTKRYEQIAYYYAQYFFWKLKRYQPQNLVQYVWQHHFMYRNSLVKRILTSLAKRPLHR